MVNRCRVLYNAFGLLGMKRFPYNWYQFTLRVDKIMHWTLILLSLQLHRQGHAWSSTFSFIYFFYIFLRAFLIFPVVKFYVRICLILS
jgi:hypothetical protein